MSIWDALIETKAEITNEKRLFCETAKTAK